MLLTGSGILFWNEGRAVRNDIMVSVKYPRQHVFEGEDSSSFGRGPQRRPDTRDPGGDVDISDGCLYLLLGILADIYCVLLVLGCV